jgi:integrase
MVDTFPKYTYTKSGTYYFSKTVPRDLKPHYTRSRIIICLKTKSAKQAELSSKSILHKLENYWLGLRLTQFDIPAQHLLRSDPTKASDAPTLKEALDVYLKTKAEGRSDYFITTAHRNIDYVIKCLGCRSIDQYTSADAAKYRDWLVEKGLASSSVKRVFSSVKAIVNLAINELGIESKNPFAGVYLASRGDAKKRRPLSNKSLKHLQKACMKADDDLRWLIALISDTGMRLSEAAGLHVDDIVLGEVPYVSIKPHAWRSLKTFSSERKIPLVGASLWAAQRIKLASDSFCFPRYVDGVKCNSNSASAALNKWLKRSTRQDVVIHGLRHTFRDRLYVRMAHLFCNICQVFTNSQRCRCVSMSSLKRHAVANPSLFQHACPLSAYFVGRTPRVPCVWVCKHTEKTNTNLRGERVHLRMPHQAYSSGVLVLTLGI